MSAARFVDLVTMHPDGSNPNPMTSLTVENYLKSTLQISLRDNLDWVTTGRLAAALNVSPGTVTSMMKTLADGGLAEYRPYEGVNLTEEGRRVAMRVLRRHRLLELFLVQTLGLSWDQVHEEAEHMEHSVSDHLIDRIDEFLGHPQRDPHGDPIPSRTGDMPTLRRPLVALTSLSPGDRVRIVRVTEQGGDFLRYLAEAGVVLGADGLIQQNSPEAGVVSLEIAGATTTLGYPAANSVFVEHLDGATTAE